MSVQRICDPMLPELARIFSAPMGQVAQVISWFAVTYGIMQLVFGPLADRWGKYRVILLATLGCSLGSALSALSQGLEYLVAARVVTAVAAAGIIPLSLAWVGDAVDYEHRQETLARVGLGTMLGITGGQLFGGLLTDTLGWRWAFALMASAFAVVGLLMWRHQKRLEQPTALSQDRKKFGPQMLEVAHDAWARTLLGIAVLEGAMVFGLLAVTASHLHHTHHISLTMAGATTGLFGLGGMAYMASAKYTIRRFGEVGLARHGGSVLGLGFLITAFTPWWPLAMPACLAAGFGFAMFHNTMQVNATQMVPSARATGVTLFAGALFFGQSLGVLSLAALMTFWPSAWVMATSALCMSILGWRFAQAIVKHTPTHSPAT
jgi:YNFM family putative membrane transporter